VEQGRLAENITHFARALRKAGMPVGTGRVVEAIRAVEAAGFSDRADFYHTLQACFVNRPEQREVFAQVFRLFWRDPAFLEQMMSLLLPMVRGVNPPAKPAPAERRAAEALAEAVPQPSEAGGSEIEVDAALTFSGREALRHIDFEQMSAFSSSEMAGKVRPSLKRPVSGEPLMKSSTYTYGSMVRLPKNARSSSVASFFMKKRSASRILSCVIFTVKTSRECARQTVA
jgi:uncharacterized protein with von Willebrand factor type A (vWA) domain